MNMDLWFYEMTTEFLIKPHRDFKQFKREKIGPYDAVPIGVYNNYTYEVIRNFGLYWLYIGPAFYKYGYLGVGLNKK